MTGNIKLAGFEIRKIDRKEMMIGLALIALSFLMPVLFTVQNFQVREYMHLALEKQEKTDLMVVRQMVECVKVFESGKVEVVFWFGYVVGAW